MSIVFFVLLNYLNGLRSLYLYNSSKITHVISNRGQQEGSLAHVEKRCEQQAVLRWTAQPTKGCCVEYFFIFMAVVGFIFCGLRCCVSDKCRLATNPIIPQKKKNVCHCSLYVVWSTFWSDRKLVCLRDVELF